MDDGRRELRAAKVGALEHDFGRFDRGDSVTADHYGMGDLWVLGGGGSEESGPTVDVRLDCGVDQRADDEVLVKTISDQLTATLSAIIGSSFIYKDLARYAFRKLDGHFSQMNAGFAESNVEAPENLIGIILHEVFLNISAVLNGRVSSRYSDAYTHLTEPFRSEADRAVSACVAAIKGALKIPIVSGKVKEQVVGFSRVLNENHIPEASHVVAEILGRVWLAMKGKLTPPPVRRRA